jgi:tRNA U55 pseudouridine synthase TruB
MPIIELWKEYGITSNEFARRYKLDYNLDSVCYAGRLDPMACGKMMLLTNKDTKDVNKHLTHDKLYNFDLIIGINTKSHDCLSEIEWIESIDNCTFTDDVDRQQGIIERGTLMLKLKEFIKCYTIQKYPITSNYTIKHNNIKKPLWWFYTNGYKNINLPQKNVTIFDSKINNIENVQLNDIIPKFIDRIKLIDNEKTQNEFKTHDIINQWEKLKDDSTKLITINMELTVSSGFYIRQFCNDFGTFIGCGAIAFDITRLKII